VTGNRRARHDGSDPATVEAALARYVAQGRFADLPAPAVRAAGFAIRDGLGVILAGLAEPSGRLVADVVSEEAARGRATVIGRGHLTSPANAAFVNATTAHALDFDDSHHPSMTHPTAVLLPALLAVAEQRGRSGADLLTAYLHALDVATAIGGAVNPDHYSAGWHATGTVGAIGAALGSAWLCRLDAERTGHAMRIAANGAGGTRAVFGSMGKAMNAGVAARAGVVAAALAERGFASRPGTLAGPTGFVGVLAGQPTLRPAHALDRGFAGAVGGLSLKRYPSCGVTQAPIEAALRLAPDVGRADDIEEVVCLMEPYARRVLIDRPPRTGNEARFNVAHCVAVALVDGTVGMAQFSDGRVRDPQVRAVAARVRVADRVGTGAGPDMRWPCALRLVRTDGSAATAVVDEPAGRSFGELLPESELLAKFVDCARWSGLPDSVVADLVTALDGLAELPTLDPLTIGLRRRLPRSG
jgi:2-methylcitrate dehydratase PrpD